MKKVLIVSYYFPPDPQIGGLRIQGLAKYLPEFGWEPIILTKSNHERNVTPYRIVETDETNYDILTSFKKRIGLNANVTIKEQIGSTDKKNKKSIIDYILNIIIEIIAYPDAQKEWYSPAIHTGQEVIKHEKIDALISSSMPVTSHTITTCLKAKCNVPWIADFRDLWTQNHYYGYSFARKVIEKKLEIKTLRNADALTTVSENLSFSLEKMHGGKKAYTVTNGFDPQEITKYHDLTEKFTITYTGSFYRGKRDPSNFYLAVSELISDGIIDSNEILIRLYGPKEDWMNDEIEKYGLKDIVTEFGPVPRNVSLEKQRESQLLLLLLWDHPEEIGVFTGKIFEYLASQRPVLAIGGQKGVVKDLLIRTNSGMYATSVDDIKKILTQYYEEYKEKKKIAYKGRTDEINKYSQKEMARKFSMILDKIA